MEQRKFWAFARTTFSTFETFHKKKTIILELILKMYDIFKLFGGRHDYEPV